MSRTRLAKWRAANIGYIFQTHNLIPVLTAYENVEMPLLLLPMSRSERRKRIEIALEAVDLLDRADHYPRQMSGGQEQRVGIARAIVANPKVVVADEPTGDLDPETSEQILESAAATEQRTEYDAVDGDSRCRRSPDRGSTVQIDSRKTCGAGQGSTCQPVANPRRCRVIKLLPYILKTLWRHRSRTILTVSGSAVALFVFCFVGSVQQGMNDLRQRQEENLALIAFQANKFCPATSHLPQDYEQEIQKINGVREVVPIQVFTNNCRASLDVVVFYGVPPKKLRIAQA